MWLFTDEGFFSAVAHRDVENALMVRARVRADLVNLTKRLGVSEDEISDVFPSDYPYRLVVPRVLFVEMISDMLLNLDYDNFKNVVTQKQGRARHDLYMKVWSTMADAEGFLARAEQNGLMGQRALPSGNFEDGWESAPTLRLRPPRAPEKALARAQVLLESTAAKPYASVPPKRSKHPPKAPPKKGTSRRARKRR